MTEIVPDEPIKPAFPEARGYAESLIEVNCAACEHFRKALALSPCICEPVMDLITAHIKSEKEEDSICASWMDIQKESRGCKV